MWYVKEWLSENITDAALWLVHRVNRSKSRCLSQRLWELAEGYNTRPGTNNYDRSPSDGT